MAEWRMYWDGERMKVFSFVQGSHNNMDDQQWRWACYLLCVSVSCNGQQCSVCSWKQRSNRMSIPRLVQGTERQRWMDAKKVRSLCCILCCDLCHCWFTTNRDTPSTNRWKQSRHWCAGCHRASLVLSLTTREHRRSNLVGKLQHSQQRFCSRFRSWKRHDDFLN